VGRGRKSSGGLLVPVTVSVSVHVRRGSVGGGSSLSSHVRRDIGGSLGVELDTACLSATSLWTFA